MKKCGLLALLLALALLLTGCSQGNEPKTDDVVVSMLGVTYTYGDLLEMEESIRLYYDEMAAIYELYGIASEAYSDADIRNMAINELAYQCVQLAKADEYGLTALTNSEKAEISASTTTAMAEYRSQAEASLTLDENATAEEITAAVDAALAEKNITRARVYRSEYDSFILHKLEHYLGDQVSVSESDFVAAFNEQVASEQASYAEDLSAYGYSVLYGGSPLYTPAGYREVEWMLLDYAEEDAAALESIQTALDGMNSTLTASEEAAKAMLSEGEDLEALVAQVTVTLAEVTDPAAITVQDTATAFEAELSADIAAAVTTVAQNRALAAAYDQQLTAAQEKADEALALDAESVVAHLKGGDTWERLSELVNTDPEQTMASQIVCEGYAYEAEAFVNAAMALENVGDVSDPVYLEGTGYFVIRYKGDVAESTVDMETVREELTAELLSTKQESNYSAQLNTWVSVAQSNGRLSIDSRIFPEE